MLTMLRIHLVYKMLNITCNYNYILTYMYQYCPFPDSISYVLPICIFYQSVNILVDSFSLS